MFGLEARVIILERWMKDAARTLGEFAGRLKRIEDKQAYNSGSGGGGGGSGTTVYFANNLTLAAATGTWPTITPTSTTADVYKEDSSGLVIAKAGATIYNFLPDATNAANRQILGSNGDGTFSVSSQSCSAG